MDFYIATIASFYAFALGCCVASFLNVCIWRLPRGESVVRPASHCPRCGAPIRWWQNIPLLSYIALGGRCARCREPISLRYPTVELLGGVLFLAAWLQWIAPGFAGLCPRHDIALVPVSWLVFSGLILGSFIDLDHYYLPDRVTIGGMLLGVPLSWCLPELQGVAAKFRTEALCLSLGGAAFGFLFLWGIGWVFSKAFKKDALGFGDVKLLGAVGAFFGPVAVLFVIIASSFIGALAGVVMILRKKARLGGFTAIPYGPFISAAVVVWMLWGPSLASSYLRLLSNGSF